MWDRGSYREKYFLARVRDNAIKIAVSDSCKCSLVKFRAPFYFQHVVLDFDASAVVQYPCCIPVPVLYSGAMLFINTMWYSGAYSQLYLERKWSEALFFPLSLLGDSDLSLFPRRLNVRKNRLLCP